MLITARYTCAYCGTVNTTSVDPSGGMHQEYEEDCEACCRSNRLRITLTRDGSRADIDAEREED